MIRPPLRLLPLLLLAAASGTGCIAHTPAIPGPDGRPLPGSIASLEKIELGGVEQWILVRGADTTNPVLLRLHGGPGAAEMPLVHRYNGDLEEHFVVVAWDQRGAGKSNRRGFDEASMTFEQFLRDAHELTLHLKARFGQERIYLVGHSWGTQLGIRLAARHPEDYWAWVGVSQLVNQERGSEIAHGWLRDRLGEEERTRELVRLEALGPPPYPDHADYVRFIGMVDAEGGGMDVGFGRLAWAALRAPEYTLPDLARWLGGARRGSGPMWDAPDYRGHDLFRGVPRLEVPAYFFAGRRDYNTPLALVREYAEFLEAPAGKEVVVFEASAHTPFLAEPDRFRDAMLRVREETWTPERGGAGVAHVPAPGEPEPLRTDRVILPFLFHAPETKLGGGAVAAGYRRLARDLPSSSVLVAATFTARRQLSLEAETEIHRRGGGRVDASARFSHFPDRFFGVGPDTPDGAEEAFTSRNVDLRLRVQRQVRPGLRVGPQARFRWEELAEVEEGGLLAGGTLTGAEGGSWLGLGAVATLDRRDNVLQPRQGVHAVASFLEFPGGVGSTGYRQGMLDLRRFLPLGEASTVAFRTTLQGAGGDVPVLLLPALGGRDRLRGYYDGRFRDRVLASAQGEVRFPVWRRLGAAAFGEVGQVAPRLGDLASGRPEMSAGAGLRFRLGEDAARIRVDYAVGRKGSGLYLTLGEVF
jgi:pimeloyl-ACP methyl ester carboxylesterase